MGLPKLGFEEQDIVELLIFGVQDVPGIALELGLPVGTVELELQAMERAGLVRRDSWNMLLWVYCGGRVSEFFQYTQGEGRYAGV